MKSCKRGVGRVELSTFGGGVRGGGTEKPPGLQREQEGREGRETGEKAASQWDGEPPDRKERGQKVGWRRPWGAPATTVRP